MTAKDNGSAVATRGTRELVTRKDQIETVRGLLEKYKPQMQLALPKHLSADRLVRLAMTCVATEPKLLQCTQASMISCVMQIAQLGLEPGILGECYLLPYRNNKKNCMEVQIIPGYKGLLKLARNSGQISTVSARVVYKQDEFQYSFGLVDEIRHIPTTEEVTSDDLEYAYSIAKLKDGGVQFEILNKREIHEIRSSSRSKDKGPWVTHPASMWKKSALKRLCKLLPASVELQTAVALDQSVEVGIPQNLDVIDLDPIEGEEDSGE